MNTLPIIVLTEAGGGVFGPGEDHAVYINPACIVSWTSAAAPANTTAVSLVNATEASVLYVRESPEQLFELVTGERVPTTVRVADPEHPEDGVVCALVDCPSRGRFYDQHGVNSLMHPGFHGTDRRLTLKEVRS